MSCGLIRKGDCCTAPTGTGSQKSRMATFVFEVRELYYEHVQTHI